jgi:hypothetical protein
MMAKNNHPAHGRSVWFAALISLAAAILITACGGGGSSGSSSPPPPAASLTYPSSTFVYVVGTAITPVVPTASSGLSSFTVSPALPAGLSLNSSNGTLSGTPTAASAAATYTVTASGGGATATASLSITVNPASPSSVSYPASAFTFTTNIAANTLTPTAGGGAVSSWSIAPALPAGLTFDTTTGAISGTPTAASAASSYVVTAQNAGGQSTVTLTIEVDSGVLLDVGHQAPISVLRMSGSSVLSVDQSGHWNLWDYTSGSEIVSGNLYCAPNCSTATGPPAPVADMAGGTIALVTQNGFEFLSSTTGQPISTITASGSWWSLASDGSYLVTGSSTGLSVWSPSGTALASLSGDYSKAVAFAAPGQIQLAASPAGQNVIQTVSVPSGTATTGPAFNGTFSSWFLDGSRFITTAGTTVLVYSPASALQATMVFSSAASFVGQGNWIWSVAGFGGELQIFPVATSSAPVASLTIATAWSEEPSGTTLAVENGYPTGFEVIDLSGSSLSETPYSNYTLYGYAAASTSQWMLSSAPGVLLDGASLGGTLRYFDYGMVSSIAGGTGSIAVATASGQVVYFDATTLAQEGVIPILASQLLMSSDGSVLATVEDGGLTTGIYSLPAATLLYTWSYPSGGVTEVAGGVGLSGSGTILTQVLAPTSGSGPITLEASPATGGSPTFSTTVNSGGQIFASPNGTLFATTSGSGTDLWNNSTLVTAVTGSPVGWVDDGHLLVNTYALPFPGAPEPTYAGCNVYSPTGQSTGSCALPQVSAFDAVTSDLIYAVNLAEVLSISTGDVSWMSGDSPVPPGSGPASVGAVAGTHVIFMSGSNVLAQGF